MTTLWHFIAPEYPPKIGGVGDYTRQMARGLAAVGDDVHVWCPRMKAGPPPMDAGVAVHAVLGNLGPTAIEATDRELNRFPKPRRLIVQWVPHGYGWKSMNLPFIWWLCERARRDVLDVMFHEAFQDFAGRPRHHVMAAVQRAMAAVLLHTSDRIWCSTPAWIERLKFYTPRGVHPKWLPIPSNVPSRVPDSTGPRPFAVGHFGTFGAQTIPLLEPLLSALRVRTLLIGVGSDKFRSAFIARYPDAADRVAAAGTVPLHEVREHLHRCEIMVQPIVSGVTVRNTSVLAVLANGRPLVTNTGRLTEPCWAKKGAAVLLPEFGPDVAVAAVGRLLDNPVERERLSRAGQEWYDRTFDVRHGVAGLRAR